MKQMINVIICICNTWLAFFALENEKPGGLASEELQIWTKADVRQPALAGLKANLTLITVVKLAAALQETLDEHLIMPSPSEDN